MPDSLSTISISKSSSFEILGQHARGGMADIYMAIDGIGGQIVVRQLRHEHRYNLRMRRRFRHGIKVRRKLGRHPNVVQYYSEGGSWLQPYEVLEYVPGESLKALIVKKHRLVWERPFDILRQTADALAHVHAKGFLHLDVKPENLLVRFEGDGCCVKLTDFDFCQPLTTKRVAKKFGGSMLYEPPEFMTSKEVSVRTDFFAFGVLAYNLFTFTMPFMESSHDALREGTDNLRFPNDDGVRLTAPMKKFICRCLDPRPDYRFASDQGMRKVLEKAIADHESYATATGKFRRRK